MAVKWGMRNKYFVQKSLSNSLVSFSQRFHISCFFSKFTKKKVAKTKNVAACVMPDDIIIEILLRLPVTSILLCMFVCKRWLSLINNQNFIQLHLNRPVNNHILDPILVVRHRPSYYDSFFLNLLPDNTYEALDHLFPSRVLENTRTYLLMGPCNGLFCISNWLDFFVFNPATGQSKHLPRSTFHRSGDAVRCCDEVYFDCAGFGFDPITNDYVVVTLNGDGNRDCKPHGYDYGDGDEKDDNLYLHNSYLHNLHLEVQIFSLGTNSWRELDCFLPSVPIHEVDADSLFFHGAIHWLGYKDWSHIGFIVVFDLSKEDFKWFDLPICPYFVADGSRVYLSILNESLAVIEHSVAQWTLDPELEIWVMREYGADESWMKLYDISHDLGIARPLSFTKEKDFLAVKSNGQLMSLNLETKEAKELQVHGDKRSMQALQYRESLVSLR